MMALPERGAQPRGGYELQPGYFIGILELCELLGPGCVVQLVALIVDSVIGIQLTIGIFSLVVLLPGIAVGVRRLHDLDRSGWWLLLGFVPLVGIILIVWFCMRGTPGPNRFGPDPLARIGQFSPRPAA